MSSTRWTGGATRAQGGTRGQGFELAVNFISWLSERGDEPFSSHDVDEWLGGAHYRTAARTIERALHHGLVAEIAEPEKSPMARLGGHGAAALRWYRPLVRIEIAEQGA